MKTDKLTLQDWVWRVVAYVLLTAFGFLMIFPFLYMMSTSLKRSADVFHSPPRLLPYSQNIAGYEGLPLYQIEADDTFHILEQHPETRAYGYFAEADEADIDASEPRNSRIAVRLPLAEAEASGEVISIVPDDGEAVEFPLYDVTVDGENQLLALAYTNDLHLYVDPLDTEFQGYFDPGEVIPVDMGAYRFRIDGEVYELVATEHTVRYGFFSPEALINADEPVDSEILIRLPWDEAEASGQIQETGEELVLTTSDGGEEDFDLYLVTVDGEEQELALVYRRGLVMYMDPSNLAFRHFERATEATESEFVDFQWSNYSAFFDLNLNRALINTALVTVLVVSGQLVTSIFGGYAFSRVRFRGRDALFLAYLGSIMIPFVVLIIPMFRLMVILDWQNRIVSLIVPWVFTAYGTFLLRQFFMSIPAEIEEAALLDGASRVRILWQIFVPLSRPAIATLAIFSFLYAWNSFLWPLLAINEANVDNHVLTLALIQLSNVAADRPNIVLTGAAIAILPPMIVFVFAQRYFIEGVATSGLKG